MIVKKEQAIQLLSDVKKEFLALKVGVEANFIQDSIDSLSKSEAPELNITFIIIHLMDKFGAAVIKDTLAKLQASMQTGGGGGPGT